VFDRREVERLAARTRRGGRAGAFEVYVDTDLSLLDPAGALFFRGRDTSRLTRTHSFEEVAELLWACPSAARPWTVDESVLAAARAAVAALGDAASSVDACRLAVQVLATHDADRASREPAHVVAVGRAVVAASVDVLPRVGEPAGGSIAERLWAASSGRAPTPAEVAAVQAALSLLADHELAASTLAARVAASVWADPYLVVLAGLSALSGQLHGAVSGPVQHMLASALESGDADRAVAAAVDSGTGGAAVPGFGHRVYRGVDPRAETLLDLVAPLNPSLWPTVDAVLAAGARVSQREPNVDFALAALVCATGLAPGAGELIFAVARMAGMIGHALEEYPHRLRFRPRAVYTGPEPGSEAGGADADV
jgi:citrate synthase